ncbi:MAG: hypothetical protein KKG59_07870 [Nanoarchaeota archaeon]|nr:hypothetical protein [Nanoarchaeota archaeon]
MRIKKLVKKGAGYLLAASVGGMVASTIGFTIATPGPVRPLTTDLRRVYEINEQLNYMEIPEYTFLYKYLPFEKADSTICAVASDQTNLVSERDSLEALTTMESEKEYFADLVTESRRRYDKYFNNSLNTTIPCLFLSLLFYITYITIDIRKEDKEINYKRDQTQ